MTVFCWGYFDKMLCRASAQQDRKKMSFSRLGKDSILSSFLFAMSFNIQHRFCT